jgi:8-oxo-dGTP pyrophosphatase MutT (NUDIX family)
MSDAALRASTRALVRAYLAAHFDEAATLRPLIAHLDAPGDPFARANAQGHLTSSALVLSPALDEALLIHHRFLGLWLQPGGHHEAPGSLWESACREVAEETGVASIALHPHFAANGLPLDIDSHRIPDRPEKGEAAHWHHDLCFLAVARERGELSLQLEEVQGARWLPIDDLARMSNRRVARLGRKLATLATTQDQPSR